MKINSYNNINIDNLTYIKPQIIDSNTYLAKCKLDNKDFIFTTPKLKCNMIIHNKDYTILELIFNKTQWNFYNFFHKIDEQNIININNNSVDWFNQKFPIDVLDDFYQSNIRIKKNSDAPILRFKINNSNINNLNTNLGESIKVSDIKENCNIIINLKLKGLIFLKQRVYCDWEINDLLAYDLNIFKDSFKNIFKDNNFSDDDFEELENPEEIKFKKIDFNKKKTVKFKDDKSDVLLKTQKELEKYKRLNVKNEKQINNLKVKINSILN